MKLETVTPDGRVAAVAAPGTVIATGQDAIDLIADASYQDYVALVLEEDQLSPEFFDLSSGLAGEVLQKFSNFRMRLAIIGDFDDVASESLRAFIRESNRGGHVAFVRDRAEALAVLGERVKR